MPYPKRSERSFDHSFPHAAQRLYIHASSKSNAWKREHRQWVCNHKHILAARTRSPSHENKHEWFEKYVFALKHNSLKVSKKIHKMFFAAKHTIISEIFTSLQPRLNGFYDFMKNELELSLKRAQWSSSSSNQIPCINTKPL